ncbi:response regulator transcription factor [Nocardioides sp. CN2-186]|uniref:response regulator transcription factor n=1 Tax=Nocardioides tweenelious TaxID=3156607 RepID=UPI0032B3B395
MSEGTTRVLLVDDHDLVRDGLKGVFGMQPDMQVVGAAGSVAEALDAYAEHRPDVVVTDLQLPDGTGIDIVRSVRRDCDRTGLVILTMHYGDQQMFAAMEAGASAMVGKDVPSTDVVRAARQASISPRSFAAAGLVQALTRRTLRESGRLTDRETEILHLLADGLGLGEIAARLYVSRSTAKTHTARIYQKLGATNRAQALMIAMRTGLLSSVGSADFN